jgi:hypothetical protein
MSDRVIQFPNHDALDRTGHEPSELGRAARLLAKMFAVPANTIFKWEELGRATLDDADLSQVVDYLRRHAKTARQGVR